MELETLEKAIEQELKNHFFSNISEIKQAEYFINFGAKWQAERMYSEEEVLDLLVGALDNFKEGFVEFKNIKKWFEQFEKK